MRWLNYLRPDIKRGNISRDEEELIFRLHSLLGNRYVEKPVENRSVSFIHVPEFIDFSINEMYVQVVSDSRTTAWSNRQ